MSTVVFQSGFQPANFSVPYVSPISGGLEAGKAIFIQGAIPAQCDRFVVNLKCGQAEGDDIAFQFKPEFSSKSLILNSCQGGSWGKEERLASPLQKGSNFDLIIAVHAENYQVFLDGGEVGQFKHRIPLQRVTFLDIGGQITLTNVVFIESFAGSNIFGQSGMVIQEGVMTVCPTEMNQTWSFGGEISGTTQVTTTQLNVSTGQEFEFSILNPVQNPKLPYTGPISGGLKAKMALFLQGTVTSKADRFAINFKTGQTDKDDIAFNFNPQLKGAVVMNSFRNGKWETEEKISNNPFKAGEAFQMFMVTKPEGYELYINGMQNYIFKHRIPLEKVTALNITGDVDVNILGFIENWSTISLPQFTTITSQTGSLGLPTIHPELLLSVQNPTLPYVGQISGGLKPGMAFYLKGVTGTKGDRFSINFKTGQADKDDNAFRFNPQYNAKVVMNTFRNGGWEVEEYGPDNPFKKGEAFDTIIVIRPEGYQVYVNGKEHYLFKHRLPIAKVSALSIDGDVIVNLGGFIQTWSTSSFATTIQPAPVKPTVCPTEMNQTWSFGGEISGTTQVTTTQLNVSTGQEFEFSILNPVQNPKLPYTGPISGGLKAKMALFLQGTVTSKADRFAINFKTGQTDKDDIAFNFNPQLKGAVVMNSFRNGKWETEEKISNNPFKAGEAFQMFMVTKPEGYELYINGMQNYIFKHRIPLEKVTALNITGDVDVNILGFIENWSTISLPQFTTITSQTGGLGLPTIHPELLLSVQNPTLPYVGPISGGLKPGMAFYLKGVTGTKGDRFSINFKTGQADKDDNAFRFNPQYNAKVVMNTFRNGVWEVEEYGPDNPFKKGEAFETIIVIRPEGYQVYVNGKEHYLFKHRLPLAKVSALSIDGDVIVNLGGFIQTWSTSSFATTIQPAPVKPATAQPVQPAPVKPATVQPIQPAPVQPVPVKPAPVQPAPVQPVQPAPVKPATVQPAPVKPATVQPAPVQPAPIKPATVQPVQPAPVQPAPVQPVKPAPVQPAPVQPAPVQPAPVQPAPVQPAPVQPVKPAPVQPAPVQPAPVQPTPVQPATIQTATTNVGLAHWSPSTIQSQLLIPVKNPALPYVTPISGGLKAGLALYLKGVAGTKGDRFAINFKTGQSDKDDIAFHYNPRYNSNVVMNTFRNGGWEVEEYGPDNPFKMGEDFEMFIAIRPDGYQVYVNGKDHYLFKHRIPLEKVSVLNIVGDVAVNLVGFIQNWTSLGFLRWGLSTIQSEFSLPVQNPALPYVGPIPEGLKPGEAMYFQGVVGTTGDRFAINLKTGKADNDDIAFHFNPRYNSKVVMNTFRNGGWEVEEYGLYNPFKLGEAFEIFIVIKPEGYQIYVNGREYYLFKHRIPLEKVTYLNICGNVVVNLFAFIRKWSTSLFATQLRGFLRWSPTNIYSELSLPAQNPALPYVGPISGGLRVGLALYLQGVAGTKGDRFAVNFKTGQSDKDDIAFHYNPRYNSNVVMNTFRNGGWEAEEFGPDNPFKMGEAFEMFIVIRPDGYLVYVNGKEHYLYRHRIALDKVSALNIVGDVAVKLVGFIQNWNSLGFLRWGLSTIQSEFSLPVHNVSLPYMGSIPEGLKAGLALYFQGIAGPTGDRFAINFKTGQADNDDIAFHFNPRDNSKVVMNSFRNGGWEVEEYGLYNPFKLGEAFEIFIVIKPEGYQVYVNGREYYLFKHRIPLEKVTYLNICGNVVVNLFAFIQKWSTSLFATQLRGFLRWSPTNIHSELSLPAQNPALPYVGPISGGLRAGLALYLQGVAGTKGDRFAVNFKTGQSDKDDIALHYNPRYNSDVVMNTFRNGGWEAEEFGPDNPFKMGEAFEMVIVIRPDGYLVYVNGKGHYLYRHRIPLDKVSYLNISGDVAVKLVGFIQNWNSLGFLRWGLSTIQSEFSFPVHNVSLPYMGSIPDGLKAGLALYFQGIAGPAGDRFAINFKTGQADNDDIAFHFNPRYNSKVVMNSFRNGGWEVEEYGPDNPFKLGEAFEIFIVIKPEGYQVYVNGREYYLFKHRIPLEKVTYLNICGNVVVNLFAFIQKWSTSLFATQLRRILRWSPTNIHSELSHPAQNPALPYVGPISGGLKAGLALYMQGVAGTKGDRFAVNFKTGQSDKDDIAFHYNPRYNSDVVMNTFRNGGWEAEEFGPVNPFKMGEPFEMFIVIRPDGYLVYVNGNEHYLYRHRIALDKVSYLNIVGDVAVKLVGFIQNWNGLGFLRWGLSTIQSEFSFPVHNLSLPYMSSLPERLKAGLALYFQGIAGPAGDRFAINFKTGQADNDDIAFHFNPRYNSKVVMNTFKNGGWEVEEYGLYNPFKLGEAFEIFVVIKPEGYQVYVNGREYYLFKHRIPLEKVTYLNICGNVFVNLFTFIQKWSTSLFATQLKGFLRWSPTNIHSELSLPAQNPALPYVGPISGGLKAGMALYLQGVAGSKDDRFAVNFKTGQSDKDDIAFHYNPRYNSDVVMNTFRNGGWEAEEFGPDNPFKMGEAFEMFIVIRPDGYLVYVNGKGHYLYRHRIPLDKVSALNICGDVTVKLVGFIQNWNSLGFLRWGLSTIQSEFSLPVHNVSLPYMGSIPEGLKAGLALYFQGLAGPAGDQFAINFKTGQADNDDIAFHFNPRYNSKLVMNSFRNGGWEVEEYGSDNPFKLGEAFEIFIVINPEGYQVYVNGREYYLFKHRIPLEKVKYLNICGNVVVNLFAFIQKWSTSLFATQLRGFLRWSPTNIHSELSLPAQNPTLPYVGPISGGLRAGLALYLQGVAGTKGDRFAVNFKTGQSDKDDIAFHYNPRYNSNVVMNTFRNGGWEAEEFGPDNPFKMGEAFEMFIVIRPDGYLVYVNGKEHYLYRHRIALDKVSALNIVGDVAVKLVGFIQNWNSLGFLRWGLSTIQSEFSFPVHNLSLPYTGSIREGLKAGLALYFQGIAGPTGDRFAINFKTGQADNDDIAFHFNPRYNSKMVMNTFRNGGWEVEEYGLYNPFKLGEAFEIFIVIKPEGYQVYVNGREYYLFKHRIPLEKVTYLNICGNVVVNLFAFIQKWSTSLFATQLRGFLRWSPTNIHSELSLPAQNPALPYVGPISGGLRVGLALYLQGVAGTKGDRFAVNFKTGQSDKDDIAFHYNPRYNSNVVMNTFRNGGWEAEEFGPDNPFKMGEAFEMFIVIRPDGYLVYVNGKGHYLYRHRIPLDKVLALNICGDVAVKLVGFIQNWNGLGFLRWGLSTIQSEFSLPVHNVSLPYMGLLPDGLKAGLALYFQGIAGPTGDRFAINFKTGQADNDDIAFHFNPRYNSKVVMNTFRNGGWEVEEYGPDNPFKLGEAFEIFIVIKPEGYQVYVNGREYYLFKHCIPLEKVTYLNICGNVVVNLFAFIQKWSTSLFATQLRRILRWSPTNIHSELSHPAQNPALPYVGPISGGLKAGLALYMQGVAGTKGDRFAVNFKTGQSDKDDIAFHYNPRYNSNVVMNTFRNGGWEAEEFGPVNPFKMGEAFEMFIVIRPDGYLVYVNGNEHYLYRHRIPLDKVSYLNIVGDVAVKVVGFIQNWNSLSFLRWGLSTIQSEFSFPVHNLSLPYMGSLPERLKAGLALYFQGIAGPAGDRFAINFKTGQADNDDIAFHFNPRYNSKVVMNSYRNGGWEVEEYGPDNPFKLGEAFEIFIVIKPEGYQVYVNGREYYLFKHRIPLEKVTYLNICGNVFVNLFAFIQKWSTSLFATQLKGILRWSPTNIHSELSLPAQNPVVPYVGPISGGLKAGLALYMQGVAGTKGDRFSVNFKTGQSDKDDIAFHYNPRYNSNVVMNTFRNGGWEAEEYGPVNPFKMGEAFEMFIVIRPDGYLVYVNGKGHYLYRHRISMDKVSYLNIVGDVAVKLVGFIQNWNSLGFLRWGLSTIQSEFSFPVYNLSLPYMGSIPEGLKEGLALYFQGIAGPTGDRFAINFKTGQADNDDIAFHFNPRYNSKVVMNTFRNGGWEVEEYGPYNPFILGEAFEIFIVIKPEGYQVYVNGREYYLFKHRIPLEKVTYLNICGNVVVNLFAFIQKWSTSLFATQLRGFLRWSPSNIHSELSLPAQNPALPYVRPIAGGLRVGLALYLQGVAGTKGDRFAVNFKTGQSDKDDIAFHYNPRYNSNVVMNTFRNGGWEAEEFGPDNPFKMGEAFEMFIVIRPDGYLVYVNGKEHYLYRHRIARDKVSDLNIVGDVAVKLVGFIQNWNSLGFLRWGLSTIQSEFSFPVHNLYLPYVCPIPEGLKAGLALYFQGIVGTTGDRFAINFKTGQADNDDIAFHFNPRYNSNVVMNTFRNGGWEVEEYGPDNPFKMGEAFEIFIVIKPEGYQVYVNSMEYYLFKHRIPLEKVTAINICGNVVVNLFAYIRNWSTSSFVTQLKGLLRSTATNILSELSLTLQNPSLPYVGPISGGLRSGMALYLQGVVGTNGDRFAVNFKTGPADNNDIAFHYNPRYNSRVVMNTFKNGGWGPEEYAAVNPFKMGEAFVIFIVFKPDGYQVYVNGNENYSLYKHRIPLEKVSVLNIVGDIVVNLCGFIQNWSSFAVEGLKMYSIISIPIVQTDLSFPVQNPNIPYVGPISGGVKPGMGLFMQGTVANNANRFSVNFQTGPGDNDDIAFHFNPRMDSRVVLNTRRGGGWETEEYAPTNPFKRGEAFDLFIVFTPNEYKVYVGGKELCMYKHRMPLEKVTTLYIEAGVSVSIFSFMMGTGGETQQGVCIPPSYLR